MFQRFTDRARRVLTLAQEEARLLDHPFLGTEHLLLGLIHEGEGVAAKALDLLGVSLEAARAKVAETIAMTGAVPSGSSPPFTPRAKKVLELSLREAKQLGHSYIGTEHLLLGLIREGEGVGAQVLVGLGIDLGRVRQQVIEVMSGRTYSTAGQDRRPFGTSVVSVFPVCPQCNADLVEAARFRNITVPSESADHDEPISVEVVYCSRCGVALEMFRT
jgi:ATP-dependent Clp protease ATP-binding subunit ClpC